MNRQLNQVVLWMGVALAAGAAPLRADEHPRAGVADKASALRVAYSQPPQAEAPTRAGSGKLISLQLEKADIRTALRLVADHGGLNVVIGPHVEGEVTVSFENVPVETALRAIALNNGFDYRLVENVVTISAPSADTAPKPPPTVSKAFTLRYSDAQHVKEAIEHVLTPLVGHIEVMNEDSDVIFVSQNLTSLAGEPGQSGGVATGSTAVPAQQSGAPQANSAYSGSTGAAGRSRFSRTLIVTDVQEKVDLVATLIDELDQAPPQVLIEARIIEMDTNLQRQLGIDWNLEAFANGPVLNHEWPLRNRAGFASGDQIRRTAGGMPQSVAGLALGTVDLSRLSLLLKANQDDTAIRMLANPRLLVYNNHTSSILVGERYPIFEANITDYGTVTEAFDTYIPVGIQLEVKPTIMMDGRVSMFVHPATSSLGDDVIGTTGLRVARVNTREISTRVIVRDGDTIVLGGLISDRKTHAASKIPGLGDWPILSIFFRQEKPASDRVDLLIFLTARIDGATEISERDRKIFDMYQPHFKQIERLQDVPLHFEIPTEYEWPKPQFTDPPEDQTDDFPDDQPEQTPASAGSDSDQPLSVNIRRPDRSAPSNRIDTRQSPGPPAASSVAEPSRPGASHRIAANAIPDGQSSKVRARRNKDLARARANTRVRLAGDSPQKPVRREALQANAAYRGLAESQSDE